MNMRMIREMGKYNNNNIQFLETHNTIKIVYNMRVKRKLNRHYGISN